MTASRNDKPVVVVGGGIGGLACALALARRRFSVVVLEQAKAFGEIGVGLQVAPNALSVLDALGVGEIVKKQALLIERLRLMDGVSGEPILDIPCGARFRERFGNPYAVAHRADVHGALLDACRADARIALRTSARVLDFTQSEAGAAVRLASGERIEGIAIVGADGVRSQIRSQLLDDGEPPGSGAIIFRAVIPREDMPDAFQQPYPTLWAGPKSHIIYYPVRDWSLFNFAAVAVTGATRLEREGGEVPADGVLPFFAAYAEAPRRILRIPNVFRHYVIRHREPVENWTLGRVTLLGDAAHPMVQYIAQGAAMALEDAACLAVAVDEADGDFAGAFQTYQRQRAPRAGRVQISSLMLDHVLHAEGARRPIRNAVFEGRGDEAHYERFAWLFSPPPYVRPSPV